jgi:tetratricopeptide (TPR) repeat protein
LKRKEIMEPTANPADFAILPEVALSNSLINEGRFSEAITPLQELISSGKHGGYIYLGAGDIYRQLGREDTSQNDEAKKFYEIAINLAKAEGDNQVIVAAKAGLAWLAIREVQDAFNALPDEDKWEDLKVTLPFCLEPIPIAYALGGLQLCNCKTSPDAQRKNGRTIDNACVGGGCRQA